MPFLECVGIIRILGCCRFAWREPVDGGVRKVEVRADHCERCVAELKRVGPSWRLIAAGSEPWTVEEIPPPADEPSPIATDEPSSQDDAEFAEIAERVLRRR